MQHEGRTTGLGKAFAHYGRIFKTLHLLQFIDDINYRRMIGNQLNIGESRHSLAREIAFGRRGHLHQAYKTGMEDQLSGLGLGLNAVVYWNSVYIDAAVKALEASGTIVSDEIKARISPLESGHITFHGRYTFRRPELAARNWPAPSARCVTPRPPANKGAGQKRHHPLPREMRAPVERGNPLQVGVTLPLALIPVPILPDPANRPWELPSRIRSFSGHSRPPGCRPG